MFNPLGWIRRATAQQVMLGFGDAVRALTPEEDEPPATLEELRALCQPKQLAPAADDEPEPATGRKSRR